jgi:CHASE2 domain-containing sensor protein
MAEEQPKRQTRTPIGRALHRARKPNRAHVEAAKQRVPFWWSFLVLFVFALYQIALNPFGFSDLTHRYTQDISNLLVTGPYLYPESGHEKVSVALVDDSTLGNMQMTWPLSYGVQARILDSLLALKPRAVVVDFLFVDSRKDPTLPQLVDEIGRYKKAGVPLYFEGATDTADGHYALRPELAATGVKTLDPTIIVNEGVVRQYPTTGRCFAQGKAVGGDCKSLSLGVYDDLFPGKLEPLKGLMEIVWGTRTDPINAKWMHVKDEAGVYHSCIDTMSFMRRVFLAFFDPNAVRQRCPYTGVIPADSLLSGTDDPDVIKLAQGRVVFYGASLEGTQDRAYTPVNGLLASVFVHAMAMDNLIAFDGKPEQNVVTIAGITLDNDPVQVLAILPVIGILTLLHMRRIRRRRNRKPRAESDWSEAFEYFLDKALEFFWHWLAFFLALGAGLLLTLAVGLSVANWVEVVFVSVELAALLLIGLPDEMWGYLTHVFRGAPEATEEATG